MNSNILLADMGNSRVKFKFDDTIKALDYHSDELIDFLDKVLESEIRLFYFSSVNREAEKYITERLNPKFSLVQNIKSLIDVNTPVDFSKIKGIGMDRMLSLLAVHKVTDSPIVTIDCGTAVTVNLLDELNVCLGGVIFPGFYTQSKALHNYTSNLPLIEEPSNKGYFGENTEDAIRYGILNSIVGGIKATIDHSSFSSVPNIFVTGGYGELIKDHLLYYYPNIVYDEDLVLKGIEKSIRRTTNELSIKK